MDIDGLLQELGRRMNFGSLRLDANDACRIVFDERMVVDVEADRVNDAATLHGVVAPQAVCETEGVPERLLAANLAGVNGHDNYLCLDTERREVVLFARLSKADADYESFVLRLEHFVNDLEHWLEKFDAAELGADAGAPARAAAEPPTVLPFGALGGVRI